MIVFWLSVKLFLCVLKLSSVLRCLFRFIGLLLFVWNICRLFVCSGLSVIFGCGVGLKCRKLLVVWIVLFVVSVLCGVMNIGWF